MKSAVAHAIKTNHFPEATRILSICWRRCFEGLPGIHFTNASYREQCMTRGWSVNHEGLFSFTSTHDLCDASFSKGGLEAMVRQWYRWELDQRIMEDKEFERKHPEVSSIPYARKALQITHLMNGFLIFADSHRGLLAPAARKEKDNDG